MPWVIVGIVIVALSLRAPIIAPTAVITDIQAETGLSAVGAGLLTGLPVLLFALMTPLATRSIRRFGPEGTIVLCLAGVLAGTIIRSLGPASVVLAGTMVIGAAMTLGNIAVPVLIRRDVPFKRISAATGLYSATMNIGSMATLLGTAPLAAVLGWRWAIAAWGVVTAAGLLYWLLRKDRADTPDTTLLQQSATPGAHNGPGASTAQLARTAETRRFRRVVSLLVLAFCGQSAAYFATTAWLPLLLADTRGLDAAASGAASSLFQIAAVIGAFGVPLLASRTKLWIATAVIAMFWVALPIGLLAAPEAFVLWAIIGGVAQGGGFTAIFSIIPRVAHNNADTASASARIQTGGYLAATCAPPLAGWLNGATGSWTMPLALVLAATLAFSIGGLLAARLAERPTGPRIRPE
ncbi:MFS transporter [Arthrobacter sp. 7749]|uniref:MFS transporter n=1 Tax=Paeniglutamicibacter terrestris TaxID=2723403 RepID=A0ABX1G5V6_9MICC|nr:MFS transporter [Paeniglutamicibacter terrestris]ASN41141.1 MFS transporter [Arthrobacter sp. 7749]NKG21030.1 MFS transporter [Paeniglutamicibacter terrestris]